MHDTLAVACSRWVAARVWVGRAAAGDIGGTACSPHGAQLSRGGRKRAVRTIAITGSASGIGAATRGQLEAAGHRIIGVDLEGADVDADLADADQRARAVDEVLDALSLIHI